MAIPLEQSRVVTPKGETTHLSSNQLAAQQAQMKQPE